MRSLEQQLLAGLKELQVKSAVDSVTKYSSTLDFTFQFGYAAGLQKGIADSIAILENLLKQGEKD